MLTKKNPKAHGVSNKAFYSWIFSNPEATQMSNYLAAHEIAHCFGLLDLCNADASSGPDKNNLMNNANMDSYKLRRDQWQTIRAHHND